MSASPPIRKIMNNAPTTMGVGPGSIARRKLHVVRLDAPPPEPSVVVTAEPAMVAPEPSVVVTPEPSTVWCEPPSLQVGPHTDTTEAPPEVPMSRGPRYIALALFGLAVALCAAVAFALVPRSPSVVPSGAPRTTLPAPTAPSAQLAPPRPVPAAQVPVVTPVVVAAVTREAAARRVAARVTRPARRSPVARSPATAAPSPGASPSDSTTLARCLAR